MPDDLNDWGPVSTPAPAPSSAPAEKPDDDWLAVAPPAADKTVSPKEPGDDEWQTVGEPEGPHDLNESIKQRGVIGALEGIPSDIAHWWKTTPSALEQQQDIQNKIAAITSEEEKNLGRPLSTAEKAFGASPETRSQIRKLMYSSPLANAFMPGEGLYQGARAISGPMRTLADIAAGHPPEPSPSVARPQEPAPQPASGPTVPKDDFQPVQTPEQILGMDQPGEVTQPVQDQGKTVPEAPETLEAQMDQLEAGRRKGVLIPHETATRPDAPEGSRVVSTPSGDVYYKPDSGLTYGDIIRAEHTGNLNEILGLGPVSKTEALAREARGEQPVAVTERQPDGVEVKAAAGTDQTAPAQVAALDRDKTPGNTVQVETPENVINKRAYRPNTTEPKNILQFLARKGGVQDPTGELQGMDLHKRGGQGFQPGFGWVRSERGLAPDYAREAAEEAGWLHPGSTVADLYNAIDDTLKGREATTGREAELEPQQQQRYYEPEEEERAAIQNEPELAPAGGPEFSPEDLGWPGFNDTPAPKTEPRGSFQNRNDDIREFLKDDATDPHSTNLGIARYILSRGRETGMEHAAIYDTLKNEIVGANTDGLRDFVRPPENAGRYFNDPTGKIIIHHNHPSRGALSGGDISALAYPGTDWIIAHGHDGEMSAAQLNPALKRELSLQPLDDRTKILQKTFDAANDEIRKIAWILKDAIGWNELTTFQASTIHREMVNHALAEAGVTNYVGSRGLDFVRQGLAYKIDKSRAYQSAVEKARSVAYGPAAAERYTGSYRPPESLRPTDGMGRILGTPVEDAGAGSPRSAVGDREGPQGNRPAEPGTSGAPSERVTEATQAGEQHVIPGAERETPEQVGARQRAAQKAEAEARMLGKQKPTKTQEDFGDTPLAGGKRQGTLFDNETPKFQDENQEDMGFPPNRPPGDLPPGLGGPGGRGWLNRLPTYLADKANSLLDVWHELQTKFTPMATGTSTATARATAKDFANGLRLARWHGQRMDDYLTKNFSYDQLQRMWRAADEESVARQQGKSTEGIGLSTLAPKERAAVDALQADAARTLAAAKAQDMFKGEGLPSYAPRMVVEMTGAGAKRPRTGEPINVSGVGSNLRTSTQNLKKRHYLTTEETEAAAERAGINNAKVVDNIRTLPLATARLREAIAGRALINKIKELGDRGAANTVLEGGVPENQKAQFFTIDHPAFKTWRPKFEKNEETGKVEVAKDAHGNPQFEQVPIYVRKDFEGPLNAVLSRKSGLVYNGLMALKGKATSMIMYSPLIHNAVEWGRAFPAMPGKVGSFKIYFEGNKAKNDPAVMSEAIKNGLVPIGKRFFNQDITSMAEEPQIQPGRSWTAKLLGGAMNVLDRGAGTTARDTAGLLYDRGAGEQVKAAIDKMGDVWHNTLLWDRIADLQMGLYKNMRDHLVDMGNDPQTAARTAAHFANRYAGALPMESMSNMARKIANVTMFSRSFTLGNIGAMKDMLTGLPRDVQAQILRDRGTQALSNIKSYAMRKSVGIIAVDLALAYGGVSALQSAVNVMRGDKSLSDEEKGYADRLHKMFSRVKENPSELLQPFNLLQSLSSTTENEPGKEDRVKVGHDNNGTAVYARNPVGKIGEEFAGWATSPLDMVKRKLSTIVRPTLQVIANDKGFGQKVYDPYANTPKEWVKNIGNVMWQYMESQAPTDSLKSIVDYAHGREQPEMTAAKTVGPLLGVTFSRGAPGGEAVGEMYNARTLHDYKVQQAMPDIRRMIQDGNTSGAVDKMQELGIPKGLQKFYIQTTQNPSARLSKGQVKNFNQYATPEQKERFDRARESGP